MSLLSAAFATVLQKQHKYKMYKAIRMDVCLIIFAQLLYSPRYNIIIAQINR
jgi:hypothetical protein